MYAEAERGSDGRVYVPRCPYCQQTHYHGDGTRNGTGEIKGNRVADCFNGNYDLVKSPGSDEWAEDQWKYFAHLSGLVVKVGGVCLERDARRYGELLTLTRSQVEHPEDFEWPCECQLCCSYGD